MSVAFSGDGEMLASSGADGTITFWHAATHEPRGHVQDKGHVLSVAFSRDGKLLASGGEGKTVGLWDVANLRPTDQPLTGYKGAVASVAFNSDGSVLASGNVDGTIALWDMITPEPLDRTLFGHNNDVSSVAFSPNGRMLVSASADRTLVLWDVESRQPLGLPLTGFWGDLWGVTLRPNGKAIALIRGQNSLTLQEVATGQLIARYQGDMLSADLSPEGLLALGHEDGSVILWSVAHHKVLDPPLKGHEAGVRSVAFSPDGHTLASGDKDGTVILWDVPSHRLRHKIPKGHPDEVLLLGFSADGNTLASQSREDVVDAVITSWGATTGQQRGKLGQLRSLFRDVSRRPIEVSAAFSPDGSTLALALQSREMLMQTFVMATQFAIKLSKLSILLSTPGGVILALPAAWKFINQVLAEIGQKPQGGQEVDDG
jgi:WD40 repeat protein